MALGEAYMEILYCGIQWLHQSQWHDTDLLENGLRYLSNGYSTVSVWQCFWIIGSIIFHKYEREAVKHL